MVNHLPLVTRHRKDFEAIAKCDGTLALELVDWSK